jgi:glutathione S-transferase
MKPILIFGVPASPYTKKLLAYFRFKHIPYSMIWGDTKTNLELRGIELPKPILLPTVLIEADNEELIAKTDTTPLIKAFEEKHQNRSVFPDDPILSFINFLIEDYADEWVTKYMFHYRWAFDADANNAKQKLVLLHDVTMEKASLDPIANAVADRQISRLGVVGSNKKTAGFIEKNYIKFLSLLEEHFATSPFILGNRPSSSDFALYAQLEQLIKFDPTSRQIAHNTSMRTVAWIDLLDDLSGLDDQTESNGWIDTKNIPNSLTNILNEIGSTYAPYLHANAEAVSNGNETFEVELDGVLWSQESFKYQAKCLSWIGDEYKKLSDEDKDRLLQLLDGTGCESLLN